MPPPPPPPIPLFSPAPTLGLTGNTALQSARQLHDAAADDRGLFCGDGGAQLAAWRPDLRFTPRAGTSIAAVRRSHRRYSSGRCTSRKYPLNYQDDRRRLYLHRLRRRGRRRQCASFARLCY